MTDAIKDEVESWEVVDIRPYDGNAKIHSQEQIESLAKAIKTFGFDQPIVVDGAGVIIKGHGRRLAAMHLGMTKVPVIVRTDLTANEANASRLSDNRVAVGDVDTNILNMELEKISTEAEDLLDAMGFTDKELEFMTSDLGDMDDSALMDAMSSSTDEVVSDALSDSEGAKLTRITTKDVLGFTHFEGKQARDVARWLNHIRGFHDTQDSAEAMAANAKSVLEGLDD